MNAKITTSGPKLKIGGFACEKLGKVKAATIDLTPHAGQHVRVWLDMDGTYSLDPHTEHFWQMAEFDVPEIQYSPGEVNEKMELGTDLNLSPPSEALPLDLTAVEVAKWELPA